MKYAFLLTISLLIPTSASAQQAKGSWPPKIEGEKHVYKTVGDRELCLWRIPAEDSADRDEAGRNSPAIIFFFGGGWTSGTPEQFLPQARYLASRGMAAFVADYRVASRDRVKAVACVEDAKSAVRWLRSNSEMLKIDPERICAAGGSAGGHIACCTALLQDFDDPGEDKSISSVPNALALFNPAVVLAPLAGTSIPEVSDQKIASLETRLGVQPQALSPVHHIRPGLPPVIIFHGEADTTVAVGTVREFSSRMVNSGNRCELKTYPGAPHGFFNLPNAGSAAGKKKAAGTAKSAEDTVKSARKNSDSAQRPAWHTETLRELDLFLTELGWISGKPTLPSGDQK